MNRLIVRANDAPGSETQLPSAAGGETWRLLGCLALLGTLAAPSFAQERANPPLPEAATEHRAEPADPRDTELEPEPVSIEAAAVPSDPQAHLMTVVEPKYEMDPTSLSPLGDDFNPTTGTVQFSITDISIPGNSAIPVELRRWVPSDDSDTGGPTGWKWNIPFIRGNFLDVKDGHSSVGWDWGAGTWRHGLNCDGTADNVVNGAGELVTIDSYWQGKLLHIPGLTSETFLTTGSGEQVTKSNFKVIGCIDNPADAQGIVQQGIVVQGPDGTTYTFNQIKTYYNGKSTLKNPIVRTRLLLISTITDRFNNSVAYNYDAAGKLIDITASDGRTISISYLNGAVYQATAHGRTWTYGASAVTLPDGRQWSYTGISALAFKPNGLGGYSQAYLVDGSAPTQIPGCTAATGDYLVTIVSPDGLKTDYTFRDTIHYRSNVEPELYYGLDSTLSRSLYCTITRSLVKRVSSGAGVGPYTWDYIYSGNRGTYTEASIPRSLLTSPFDFPAPVGNYPAPIVNGGGAENYRTVTVNGPDKKTIFYIDRLSESVSESRVIAQDTLNAAGTQLLERRESSFGLGAAVGQYWALGGTAPPVNYQQLNNHVNQTKEHRTRYVNNSADATFTTTYSDHDLRGRPTTVTRAGSAGARARTERMEYDLDNATLGVVGQLKRISVDDISEAMVEHIYDSSTAQLTSTSKFGVLQANYEYNPDGTLWKHIDGLGHATVYTDYYRGQPQRIDRANSTSETASVNDWGLVSGRTDPNGFPWSYDYDSALRLQQITPPAGWNGTTITYERAVTAQYGLPAGHWRQTVSTGNARTVTYFDVLWRPVMVRTYDTSNEANTRKVVVNTFDVNGKLVFESYPRRDFSLVTVTSPGRRMQFDALGRPTRQEADSESGVLVTTTQYLSGFKTSVTNPRNQITTQKLWAQDDPDQAQVDTITAPENVNLKITRNLLGNPTSIQRWGTDSVNGVSANVTRSYVYDEGQRLCKTLEPEVIASVQGYDLAGNVAWRAPGVNLSSNSCEVEANVPSAKKISYSYDAVNQLASVVYGDGSPGITRTYWNDGLLQAIVSNGSTWSYAYNSLRKPTSETLTYGGKTYNVGWDYDSNGNLSTLTYPTGGPTIAYVPNALGEPSKVGSYATNVAFHPNGAISGFTFGNNIVHSLTQTVEGTPKLNMDGTVLKDFYTYDANGNVKTIADQRTSPSDGAFNRTMTYDNMDRLIGVSAPGVWGNASYLYDPADNLRTASIGTRATTLTYGPANRLDVIYINGNPTNYDYDGNGNIWHKGIQTYTFDLGNRLTSSSAGGSYNYDGHGRRIRILNSDGTSRIHVYSQAGQLLWSEKDAVGSAPGTNTIRSAYIYLAGKQIAETVIGGATQYAHTDALGSPVAHTSQAGAVLNRTKFEPYGYTAAGTTPGPTLSGMTTTGSAIGFTGHVNDPETDLVYMQQRYYDPIAGRFLSIDPVTTDANTGGSFNRYTYSANNPYKFVDPDGRQERAAQNFSDSRARANGWLGFEPKQSAQGIYEKASGAARDSGLPGGHNGPQDAARHCIGSAETARQYGGPVALVLGEANEKKGDLTHNQTSEEKSMDRNNNLVGVKIALGAKSFEQVIEQCLSAVKAGETVNSLPPKDQQQPYREPGDATK